MVAQAQFSTAGVSVQPGETETLSLTLHNIGNHTETYTLVPSGLLAGWMRIEPPTVTLFGGTSEVIEVSLRPPQLATTPAGPAPLTVRIIPLDDPDDVVIAEATAIIGTFHARHIRLLQPVVRSQRRATYEFLVENSGNSQANCRLHLIDTTHRLDGDFNPAAVGIEPGGTSLVRLKMKAVRRHWTRGARTIPFSIEADQQGYPTAVANATFVQSPVVPDRLGSRFAGLVVLAGALVGLWFGVVKPQTERAAEKAVRNQPGAELVTTTVPVTTTAPTTPASTLPGDTTPTTAPSVITAVLPTAGPTPEEGTPFSTRLVVADLPGDAPPDTSDPAAALPTASYPVQPGQELRITQLIVQMPNRDTGMLTLLKGDVVQFQWNLDAVLDNNEPLYFTATPLVFESGSTLTLKLDCKAAFESGPCSEGLLIVGRLVPV